jgi:hypothetical protein
MHDEPAKKQPVNLYLHPDDLRDLAEAGPGKKSRVVALALAVLRIAPMGLIDRARVELAKRDAA